MVLFGTGSGKCNLLLMYVLPNYSNIFQGFFVETGDYIYLNQKYLDVSAFIFILAHKFDRSKYTDQSQFCGIVLQTSYGNN